METYSQTNRKKVTMSHVGMAVSKLTPMDREDIILESRPIKQSTKRLPELVYEWVPFHSSLFDTVRIIVDLVHQPLTQIAIGNSCMRCDGYRCLVRCPVTGAVATVISKHGCTQLIIEVSIPKFLTGQNVIGVEDFVFAIKKALGKVFRLMDIDATDEEVQKMQRGQFKLTRVDYVAHVDCRTKEQANALMIAAGQRAMALGRDRSFYGDETLYIGQHSRRRTFKMYQKGPELRVHPMPPNVHDRANLLRLSEGLVRLELVLRGNELSDSGLDDPCAWTPNVAHLLMQEWVDRFMPLEGQVPNIDRMDELSPILQLKLRAWINGDSLAFRRSLTEETYRTSRKKVLKVTGIDIGNQLSPEQQRDSFQTMTELFTAGFGFKDHADIWQDFVDTVNG